MRKIRLVVCFLFLASCVIFGIYMVKMRLSADHQPPVITCEEEMVSVSVTADKSELLRGITAKDEKDGDITDDIRVASMSHFVEKGKRTVTYAVFDKDNHAATVKRTLVYTDYQSPKIHLLKPFRFEVKDLVSVKMLENMTAEDCLDGDLTNQIQTVWSDDIYVYEPGIYTVTLQVSNSAGDVCAVPVEAEILDSAGRDKKYPVLKEYIAYTTVGNEIDPVTYLVEEAEDISIQSYVDYSNPGVYTIEYQHINEEDSGAVEKLFVVVEE